jgi:hypothetical protein
VARSLLERNVIHRVVEEILERADVETAIAAALESAETERIVLETLSSPGFEKPATGASHSLLASGRPEHVIESAEMQQLVEETATSSAIRAALVRSSATLRAEVAAGLRRRMESLDNAGERRCLGARGIAFAVDLGICTLFFLVGVAVAWLVSSIAGGLGPRWLAVVGRSSSLVIWLSSGRSRVRRPGCDSCTCE